MKIKDQIRMRREQLKMSVEELAKRLEVSSMSVRHWESGRSYPGKGKAAAIEQALSFRLDWNEGAVVPDGGDVGLAAADVSLLLLICRLPPARKALVEQLVHEFAGIRQAAHEDDQDEVVAPQRAGRPSTKPVGKASK